MKTTLKFELKNGKKVSMSEETAKELYDKLNEIFGCRNYPVYIPYLDHTGINPNPWQYPIITYSNSSKPNKII